MANISSVGPEIAGQGQTSWPMERKLLPQPPCVITNAHFHYQSRTPSHSRTACPTVNTSSESSLLAFTTPTQRVSLRFEPPPPPCSPMATLSLFDSNRGYSSTLAVPS